MNDDDMIAFHRNKSEKRSVSESSDDDDDAEVSAPTTPSWLRDMIVRVGSR